MTQSTFALLCFLALTDDHGEGWESSHPSYIQEKSEILKCDPSVYSALDRSNQLRVLAYLKKWHQSIPEWVAIEEKQLQEFLQASMTRILADD